MAPDLDDTVEMECPGTVKLRALATGRVVHDERGNAVWVPDTPGDDASRIENTGLSVAEGQPEDPRTGQLRRVSGVSGYNPYESGLLEKQERARKRDLRKLSKAIEKRRRLGLNPAE